MNYLKALSFISVLLVFSTSNTYAQLGKMKIKKPSVKGIGKSSNKELPEDAEANKLKANLEAYYKWAQGWGESDKDLEYSFTAYKNFIKDFESKKPEYYKGEYTQKQVSFVNKYLAEGVYEELPKLKTDIDNVIAKVHAKNNGEEVYKMRAKSLIKEVNEVVEYANHLDKNLLEDKTELAPLKKKILAEKSMLDDYINSGALDNALQANDEKHLDAVRLGKKGMSNSKYENMALKAVNDGTGIKAVITDSDWVVIKNDIDYPKYKKLKVEIIVKKDDKCFIGLGEVKRDFDGGIYGSEFFEYWGIRYDIKCENINK